MPKKILVRIILPSKTLLEIQADLVNIPAGDGEIGILAGHAELVTCLKPGLLTLFIDQEQEKYYLDGGVAEVNQQEVNIVTEFAVSMAVTDKISVQKEITALERELTSFEQNTIEYEVILDKIAKRKSLINFL